MELDRWPWAGWVGVRVDECAAALGFFVRVGVGEAPKLRSEEGRGQPVTDLGSWSVWPRLMWVALRRGWGWEKGRCVGGWQANLRAASDSCTLCLCVHVSSSFTCDLAPRRAPFRFDRSPLLAPARHGRPGPHRHRAAAKRGCRRGGGCVDTRHRRRLPLLRHLRALHGRRCVAQRPPRPSPTPSPRASPLAHCLLRDAPSPYLPRSLHPAICGDQAPLERAGLQHDGQRDPPRREHLPHLLLVRRAPSPGSSTAASPLSRAPWRGTYCFLLSKRTRAALTLLHRAPRGRLRVGVGAQPSEPLLAPRPRVPPSLISPRVFGRQVRQALRNDPAHPVDRGRGRAGRPPRALRPRRQRPATGRNARRRRAPSALLPDRRSGRAAERSLAQVHGPAARGLLGLGRLRVLPPRPGLLGPPPRGPQRPLHQQPHVRRARRRRRALRRGHARRAPVPPQLPAPERRGSQVRSPLQGWSKVVVLAAPPPPLARPRLLLVAARSSSSRGSAATASRPSTSS